MAEQEFQDFVAGAGGEFARISSVATASSNKRRLEVAQANRAAGEAQIGLEARVANRNISRSLSKFQGEQAAARAFRGGGGTAAGSAFAVTDAATAQAGDEAAIVAANAANKEIALAAQTQVILDDPVLAAIQGGIEGVNIAQSILGSLVQGSEVITRQSARRLSSAGAAGGPTIPVFKNTITSILKIPGLNLNQFLSGINIGV